MSSLKQSGDDDTETGPVSLVDDEAAMLPEPGSPWYTNFWNNIVDIWGAIERTMDATYSQFIFDENDVFDENDTTKIDDEEVDEIIKDYEKLVVSRFKDYDNGKDCIIGMEVISTASSKSASKSDSQEASQLAFSEMTDGTQLSQSFIDSPPSPPPVPLDTSKGLNTGETTASSTMSEISDNTSPEKASPKKASRSVLDVNSGENSPLLPIIEDDMRDSDTESAASSNISDETAATSNTLHSGTSLVTIKSSSIKPIIDNIDTIIQAQDNQFKSEAKAKSEGESGSGSDVESEEGRKIEIKSVATSILSGLLNQRKMDVQKSFSSGDASKVYKLIANILCEQNVTIDVRDISSRGKGNEAQMIQVWGSRITDFAKSVEAKCYLCGGPIVTKQFGGQPEMEHKLPCAVFYAKFAFIYSCFVNELNEWTKYVANLKKDDTLLKNYYILMNSSDGPYDNIELARMYEMISADFLSSLSEDSKKLENLELFVNIILPAYLSEFAYSHHLCNQLKSNHDLTRKDNLDNYYKGLELILNMTEAKSNKKASTGILAPACITENISDAERDAINAGLHPAGTTGNLVIDLRKANVKAQMMSLDTYANAYAIDAKTTQKRMILHTIKETIKIMKIPTATGKVTKKVIKQMNLQARDVAQGMPPIIAEARNFLRDMEVINKPSGRLQQKARDKLRLYLDRTYQIIKNGINLPDSVPSQLKNTYVYPYLKMRIYDNTQDYYNILNGILNKLDTSIDTIKLDDLLPQDDIEKFAECKKFVNTDLGDKILIKYKEKIDVLKGIEKTRQEALKGASSFVPVTTTRALPAGAATLLQQIKNNNPGTMKDEKAVIPRATQEDLADFGQTFAAPATSTRLVTPTNASMKFSPIDVLGVDENVLGERRRGAFSPINVSGTRRSPSPLTLLPTGRVSPSLARQDAKTEQAKDARKAAVSISRQNSPADKMLDDDAKGGRRKQMRKTRKLKRRPRKTTKRVGQRKRTIKRKSRSRKNTRRR